jgi:hypothetical protein
MVGGQHRAAGFKLKSALESARFLLLLSALVVVPLAVIGLVIYVIVAGTDLESLSAGWLGWVIALIAVFRQGRNWVFLRWTLGAVVLQTMSQIASTLAHRHGWPATAATTITGHVAFVAGLACFGVAIVLGSRSCLLWWRRRRLAQP